MISVSHVQPVCLGVPLPAVLHTELFTAVGFVVSVREALIVFDVVDRIQVRVYDVVKDQYGEYGE